MPSCNYAGTDTTSEVGSNDDNTWYSRCHCGAMPCERGSYDEAVAALLAHRAEST